MRNLTHQEAQQFYDRFGAKQDAQSFYEDKAIDVMLAHADFAHARAVVEFGCGTGRLAARLFRDLLPDNAHYQGLDISTTMIELATQRLRPFAPRALVSRVDGDPHLSFADNSFDRFLSTYVFDLLSEVDIRALFEEAHRVLQINGVLALVSLSHGQSLLCRSVTGLWKLLHSINPNWVGGCRPVELADFMDTNRWQTVHQEKIAQFGITSEVLVARKIGASVAAQTG